MAFHQAPVFVYQDSATTVLRPQANLGEAVFDSQAESFVLPIFFHN